MNKKTLKTTTTSTINYENIETVVREHVQEFMQQVLEEEVTEFLGRMKHCHRDPVDIDKNPGMRNGYGKPRKLGLMSGTIELRRPRVRGLEERFVSAVLPYFKRRTIEINKMLPELYLHGLSSGDFDMALRGLLGVGAPLSASSILRLKATFEAELSTWKRRRLDDLKVVYCWADGLYVKAGIEDRKTALLVIIGALDSGKKVLLTCEGGERESKESWLRILRDLKNRGLELPRLTVADGALGLWSALGEINPEGDEQRCWNHKTLNVIDHINKKDQSQALVLLKKIPAAETKKECEKLRDNFINIFAKKAPKAGETLLRDWDRMVTFYSYPKEHWPHLRTSNIVESPFSAVRLRTDASRRYKKTESAIAIIWKMLMVAESRWNKLIASHLLSEVADKVKFTNGKKEPNKLISKNVGVAA